MNFRCLNTKYTYLIETKKKKSKSNIQSSDFDSCKCFMIFRLPNIKIREKMLIDLNIVFIITLQPTFKNYIVTASAQQFL